MEKLNSLQPTPNPLLTGKESAVLGRRLFMRYLGTTAAAGVALSACRSELVDPTTTAKGSARLGDAIDLGDIGYNDVGVLNYAYALEQLEAAFYSQVVLTPYADINGYEMTILREIRDHEIIHRDFFKAALGSAAIPDLTPNFSSINFTNRMSVLTTARTFEAVGVSAYNGAGRLLKNADYLVLAGKIVSVEARHTAIISDMLNPQSTSFAGDDIVDPSLMSGLGQARKPTEVLALVRPFIQETINGQNNSTSYLS